MNIGKAFHGGCDFIDLRVVLHCARSQRIEAIVHSVSHGGKLGEMPDGIKLRCFRQSCNRVSGKHVIQRCCLRNIKRSKQIAPSFRNSLLNQQRLHYSVRCELFHHLASFDISRYRSSCSLVLRSVTATSSVRASLSFLVSLESLTPEKIPSAFIFETNLSRSASDSNNTGNSHQKGAKSGAASYPSFLRPSHR